MNKWTIFCLFQIHLAHYLIYIFLINPPYYKPHMEVDLNISILELPFHLKKNEFHPSMLYHIHSFQKINECHSSMLKLLSISKSMLQAWPLGSWISHPLVTKSKGMCLYAKIHHL